MCFIIGPNKLKDTEYPTKITNKIPIQLKISSNMLENEICKRPIPRNTLAKSNNLEVIKTGIQVKIASAILTAV